MKAECANCGKVSDEEKLKDIVDLSQRIDAGDEVPAGECPDCGALAYIVDETSRAQAALKVIEELTVQVTTAKGQWSEAASAFWVVSRLKEHGFKPAERGPCRK